MTLEEQQLLSTCRRSGDTDSGLHGLRPGHVEANALGAGDVFDDALRRFDLKGGLAGVEESAIDLAVYRLHDRPGAVPEDQRPIAANQVDELVAIDIDDAAATARLEEERERLLAQADVGVHAPRRRFDGSVVPLT